MRLFYMQYPCVLCQSPAEHGPCVCGQYLCPMCMPYHVCVALDVNLVDFEDSRYGSEPATPRSVPEEEKPVCSTGGSEEFGEAGGEASHLFAKLRDVCDQAPGSLIQVDDRFYVQMRYLWSLSRCYVYDDSEDSDWRQWGCPRDWKRLLRHLEWDLVGLVIINMSRQKCAVYLPGQDPEFANLSSAMSWLVKRPAALGISQRSRDGRVEYSHFDVRRHPLETMRPKRKAVDRVLARLEKVIVDRFDDVRFWRG